MDRFISFGFWMALSLAFSLVLVTLKASADDERRTVTVETVKEVPECPRVERYTRGLKQCRQVWERRMPQIVVQPRRPAPRRVVR